MYTMAILPGRYERDKDGRVIEVEPPRPCPELLRWDEAARYLRIDGNGDPKQSLSRYRSKSFLRATTIGKVVMYSRKELDVFIERMTDGFDEQ